MTTVWYKMGVHGRLCDAAQEGFRKFCWFWSKKGYGDIYVTSIQEGTHLPYSFHYSGRAFDVRYPASGKPNEAEFESAFKKIAGQGWDVVFEPTHIHVEMENT